MKYFIIVLALFFCCSISIGQNLNPKQVDSLGKVYKNTAMPDSGRLKALHLITTYHAANNPDSSLVLAETLRQLAQKLKQKKYEGYALNVIAVLNMYKGNYAKALEDHSKCLKIWEELDDIKRMGTSYSNIAQVYLRKSDFPKALDFCIKALKIDQQLNDSASIANCYVIMGIIYKSELDYENGMLYYTKALKYFEKLNKREGLLNCYNNMGNIYAVKKQHQKALECFLKNMKIVDEIGEKHGIAICYGNIGDVYLSMGNYPKALECLSKALKNHREIGSKEGMATVYINLGDFFYEVKDFKNALMYNDSALKLSKEIGDVDAERLAYGSLSKCNFKLKNYKEAFEDHVIFKELTDSIYNSDNLKKLNDLANNFESEKKEVEQAKLDAIALVEKKKQKIILWSVSTGLMLVLAFAIFVFRSLKTTHKQKVIIEQKNKEVEEKQKEILDSIHYAKRIQTSLLPTEKYIERVLNEKETIF